jgi:hypothetical protein
LVTHWIGEYSGLLFSQESHEGKLLELAIKINVLASFQTPKSIKTLENFYIPRIHSSILQFLFQNIKNRPQPKFFIELSKVMEIWKNNQSEENLMISSERFEQVLQVCCSFSYYDKAAIMATINLK